MLGSMLLLGKPHILEVVIGNASYSLSPEEADQSGGRRVVVLESLSRIAYRREALQLPNKQSTNLNSLKLGLFDTSARANIVPSCQTDPNPVGVGARLKYSRKLARRIFLLFFPSPTRAFTHTSTFVLHYTPFPRHYCTVH